MHFFVYKAARKPHRLKSKVKNAAKARRLDALTRRMQRAVELDLFKGIKTFKRRVSAKAMMEAWESGNYDHVDTLIPWEKLPGDLEQAKDTLSQTLFNAAKTSLSLMHQDGVPQAKELRIDLQNPRLRHYVDHTTGNLIREVTTETRNHVREVVARSFQRAMSPREVAAEIKGSIGLHKRYRTALKNYRHKLREQELPQREIDAKADAYEERLLRARAKAIARTETRRTANHAQRISWSEAANRGYINREKARRVWVVDGKPCEDCEPMDGQETGINEPFDGPDGPVEPGEMHPNCECIETLETE